jgi:hypothetical protein
VSQWEVSLVTSFESLFQHSRRNLNDPGVGFWNTARVVNMAKVFEHHGLFNYPLRWNTASVTTMEFMFHNAGAFNQPLDYDGWNTALVESMKEMFQGALLFDKNLTWNTSSLTSMKNMF